MSWKRLVQALVFVVCMLMLPISISPASAQSGRCPIGKDEHVLEFIDGQCVDMTPLSPKDQAILKSKNRAAESYDSYLHGNTSLTVARATIGQAATAADVQIPWVRSAPPSATPDIQPETALSYSPFEQINGNYCGPATAESTLYYQAQQDSSHYTSASYDTFTGAYDTLDGVASTDQPLLANDFWLATDEYGQTYWGNAYMPFTLNGWLGGSWYQQVASPGLSGGTLTESQYYSDLELDVGSGYVMVENVVYDGATYYPQGFSPYGTYWHWDTLYGYTTISGVNEVQQGQVYASPGYTWEPWQLIPEDTAWSAVDQGHGIVW